MTGDDNLYWSAALLDGLAAAGLRRAVLSPGSRSTPLALACERHPAIRTWVRLDERAAAFFALGLARADGEPVALVCTSGSAPAHWYPAVIEADQGRVPLVLLSADRPPELQDCGANQTVDQLGLFNGHVRAFHQAAVDGPGDAALRYARALGSRSGAASRAPLAGPVHVNIPFREPLVPETASGVVPAPAPAVTLAPSAAPAPADLERLAADLGGQRGLIVCGWDHYPEGFSESVTTLAETLGWPLLTDPLADLRRGPHARPPLSGRYDAYLRDAGFAAAHRPESVLRFGAMPVSRALSEHLEAAEAATVVVADHHRRLDPLHRTVEQVVACPRRFCEGLAEAVAAPPPADWATAYASAEQRAAGAAAALPTGEAPAEDEVIRELAEGLPDGATLFCGASLAVRDLDNHLPVAPRRLRVVGNRGASGIDGGIATTLGLAAAEPGPMVALLGDLAFAHDLNALLDSGGLDATFIVLHNAGGAIFETLPQAGLPEFEKAWLTPAALDLERAAALYGTGFRRVERPAEFAPALEAALARSGVDLIEVRLDRAASQARRQAYWQAAVRG